MKINFKQMINGPESNNIVLELIKDSKSRIINNNIIYLSSPDRYLEITENTYGPDERHQILISGYIEIYDINITLIKNIETKLIASNINKLTNCVVDVFIGDLHILYPSKTDLETFEFQFKKAIENLSEPLPENFVINITYTTDNKTPKLLNLNELKVDDIFTINIDNHNNVDKYIELGSFGLDLVALGDGDFICKGKYPLIKVIKLKKDLLKVAEIINLTYPFYIKGFIDNNEFKKVIDLTIKFLDNVKEPTIGLTNDNSLHFIKLNKENCSYYDQLFIEYGKVMNYRSINHPLIVDYKKFNNIILSNNLESDYYNTLSDVLSYFGVNNVHNSNINDVDNSFMEFKLVKKDALDGYNYYVINFKNYFIDVDDCVDMGYNMGFNGILSADDIKTTGRLRDTSILLGVKNFEIDDFLGGLLW